MKKQWRKKTIELLGVVSDRELAKLKKCSYSSVRNKRISLGIKPYEPGRINLEWTPEMDASLGTITDKAVGNKFNIPKTSVFLRRRKLNVKPFVKRIEWTKEIDNIIGTVPDEMIGKMLNAHQTSVQYRRIHVLRRMSYRDKISPHYEEPWEIVEALCKGIVRIINVRF